MFSGLDTTDEWWQIERLILEVSKHYDIFRVIWSENIQTICNNLQVKVYHEQDYIQY